jgi:hypothetical protein
MAVAFARLRLINIWDDGSLERLNKIFYNDFNHDSREKYYRSSEPSKMFMLEVLKIQLAPIAIVISFVRAYPEDSLSNFVFSAEAHF